MSFVNGTITYASAAYTYDPQGRIETVGNGADTVTYSYVPGTSQIGSSSWTNATALNTAYTYDTHKRLTGIAVNNQSLIGYTLNAKNQRTAATLPDGNHWLFGYDSLGQVAGAEKKDSSDMLLKSFSYNYDLIGNRTNAVEDSATTTYTSNIVNQYTLINTAVPTYDLDGNMLTHGGWTFTYNGENRLVVAESSDTKLEFNYDYMGRRFEKKVYTKSILTLYNWSLQVHRRFAYDGYKLIAEFDALNNNEQIAGYLWQPVGLDVPLMRNDAYYIADGNKNIIQMRDAAGTITKTYAYNPFGAVEALTVGDENPFRFSSEYADDETALVYYNYRHYSPFDGRWINRDPIEEQGGVNLYVHSMNNTIDLVDNYGLYNCTRLANVFVDNLNHEAGGKASGRTTFTGPSGTWQAFPIPKSRQYLFKCSAKCTVQVTYLKKYKTRKQKNDTEIHEENHVAITNQYIGGAVEKILSYNNRRLKCYSCAKAVGAYIEVLSMYRELQNKYYNNAFDCKDYPQGAQKNYMCEKAETSRKKLNAKVEEYNEKVRIMNEKCSQ